MHDNLHGGRDLKLDTLPEEVGDRAVPLGQVEQEFSTVPDTAQQGTHLLLINAEVFSAFGRTHRREEWSGPTHQHP